MEWFVRALFSLQQKRMKKFEIKSLLLNFIGIINFHLPMFTILKRFQCVL